MLVLMAGLPALTRAQDLATNAAPASGSETNTQEILRAYLQLQEQLHVTQLAVEQNRKEARESAAQTAEALSGRLQGIEQTLSSQRAHELESMQSSNRALLTLAGTFAGVGFLAMLLTSVFQWRTVNKLAQFPRSLPATTLSSGHGGKELSGGDPVVTVSPAEASSLRLLNAVDRLEQRLNQLEHSTRPTLSQGTPANGVEHSNGTSSENGTAAQISAVESVEAGSSDAPNQHITGLLGKGQSMLSLDDPHGAIRCFEEVLQLNPNNAEAWVRKGTALERLQQLDQAIECYDRALQSDPSLTVAYLHKGGLFNRLERFSEALECYEKALMTQEKGAAA